jgi:6-phosphogluconolactonase (cycloisomerase 2 family)
MMNLKKMICAGIGLLLGMGLLWAGGPLAIYAQDGGIRYFQEVLFNGFDGYDGLDGVQSLVLTPDGTHLYAASFYDDSLVFFSRDVESGKLTQVEILRRDNLDSAGRMVRDIDGPVALVLSPDGRFLYTANQFSNGISIFARDIISGRVTFVESLRNGGTDQNGNILRGMGTVYSVLISHDGRFLYATGRNDDAVVVFARDPESGSLTQVEVIADDEVDASGAEVDGLDGAAYMSLSPDGNFLYVTSLYESALVTFQRDSSSGQLTFVDQIRGEQVEGIPYVDGLSEPHAPLVSRDGLTLFVPARGSNQLFIFNRNPNDGKVTLASTLQNGMDDSSGNSISGLRGANFATFGADGTLYVAGYGDNAVAIFKQNEEGQFLFSNELESDKIAVMGGTFFDTMSTPTSLVISPDNRFLYATGFSSDSIAIFGTQPLPALVQVVTPSWRNLWGITAGISPNSEATSPATGSQTVEVPLVDWITPVALVIGGLLCMGIWRLLVGRARS